MELKIYAPSEDAFVKEIAWNHEDIKKEVAARVEHYANLIYDDDQIRTAKDDRATLNKFVQALESKRKEIKKQCLAPYEAFEAQLKEIIAIVNQPIMMIDGQIKNYEEQKREEKLAEISAYFDACETPFPIELGQILDPKWLNASVKMPAVKKAIDERIETIIQHCATLENLPEFAFEAMAVYKQTLDINRAIQEGKRLSEIQKQKAEYEARKAQEAAASPKEAEPVRPAEPAAEEPQKQWIAFQACLSKDDALALREFFMSRNIKYKSI